MKYKYLDNIVNYKDLKSFEFPELKTLSEEIRDFIIENVMTSGGHLGSSLGAIELSIALCKVFDLEKDKIIWDIGHQSYAYKILTNRKQNFNSLRSNGGISGFCNPMESEFDLFVGGHSSVSISNAFGLKSSMIINKNNQSEVIAIIGDAAISSGVAFEALNHLGHNKEKMIVILNDNNMSISPTTGALSKYFLKIKNSDSFNFIKKRFTNNLPGLTKKIVDKINHIDSNLFQDMGFDYYGPLDGNNLTDLVEVLEILKNKTTNNPILLHIVTKKGFGYNGIDNIKDCLHGVEAKASLELDDKNKISNTKVFGDYLIELANKDEKIVAITAAMSKGTGLDGFASLFKDRFFDVGIAEQHAVSFSAGLAKGGLKPYVCIYSTFMQRAYDQVIHDVSLANLPVKFILDRAGLVGQDGMTHAGIYDYSMFLPIYNMVVLSPGFQEEIPLMLNFVNNYNNSPIMLRFSKEKYLPNSSYVLNDIEFAKAQVIYQGDDNNQIAILAIGEILQEAINSYHQIYKNFNKKITIVNLRFAQPLDEVLILNIAKTHKFIFTIEEGASPIVGLSVMSLINNNDYSLGVKVKNIYLSKYIDQGLIYEQKQDAKINAEYIYKELIKIIK